MVLLFFACEYKTHTSAIVGKHIFRLDTNPKHCFRLRRVTHALVFPLSEKRRGTPHQTLHILVRLVLKEYARQPNMSQSISAPVEYWYVPVGGSIFYAFRRVIHTVGDDIWSTAE